MPYDNFLRLYSCREFFTIHLYRIKSVLSTLLITPMESLLKYEIRTHH